MPERAGSLDEYSRFYAAAFRAGRRVIVGEFVLGDPDWLVEHKRVSERVSNAVFIIDEVNLPNVMDGGCDFLGLTYDPRTERVTGPYCHGDA
jgi:hypothetical protein